MVEDQEVLESVRAQWANARKMEQRMKVLTNVGGFLPIPLPNPVRDVGHNLVLLFGFEPFAEVLYEFVKQGTITLQGENPQESKQRKIKRILKNGKDQVEWQDWDLIDTINKARNDVAHGRTVLGRGQCWQYLDALEHQLRAWGILIDQGDPPPSKS